MAGGGGGSGRSELNGMPLALCCSWAPWKGKKWEGGDVASPPCNITAGEERVEMGGPWPPPLLAFFPMVHFLPAVN